MRVMRSTLVCMFGDQVYAAKVGCHLGSELERQFLIVRQVSGLSPRPVRRIEPAALVSIPLTLPNLDLVLLCGSEDNNSH